MGHLDVHISYQIAMLLPLYIINKIMCIDWEYSFCQIIPDLKIIQLGLLNNHKTR